jgi:hypothetical protein
MIFLVLTIFLLFLFFVKKKIEETFEQKIIISVFSDQYGLGLGDYIRGLIFLHKNCEENCKIYAEYSEHKIANFLVNTEIKPKYNDIPINRIWHKEEVNKLNNDINLVYCNSEFSGTVTPELKEYLKNTFKMQDHFKIYFNNVYESLNLNNDFVVLHIRLNDKYFNEDPPDFKMLDDFIVNTLIPSHNKNVLVMSNSLKIKEKIINKYNFKQFEIKPVHTNVGDSSLNNLKDTLTEFFLISKSKKIYQFSEYLHASGFSKRISEIYDIPLEKYLLVV